MKQKTETLSQQDFSNFMKHVKTIRHFQNKWIIEYKNKIRQYLKYLDSFVKNDDFEKP